MTVAEADVQWITGGRDRRKSCEHVESLNPGETEHHMKLVTAHCIYCEEPVFQDEEPKQIGQERGYPNDWVHGECWRAAQVSFERQESLWEQRGWQNEDHLVPPEPGWEAQAIRRLI
jgi:hypothetical protein